MPKKIEKGDVTFIMDHNESALFAKHNNENVSRIEFTIDGMCYLLLLLWYPCTKSFA